MAVFAVGADSCLSWCFPCPFKPALPASTAITAPSGVCVKTEACVTGSQASVSALLAGLEQAVI